MTRVSICCSLYAWEGDADRVSKTVTWYQALTETAGHEFRLLLVNDGCAESFKDIIPYITTPQGWCTSVEYFESPQRYGKAIQLNRLLASCTDDYIAVVDNDVILPQNWLRGCVSLANKKDIAVCGVLVEDLPVLEHHNTEIFPYAYVVPQMIGGACLVWKRAKLGAENYFWWGGGVYGHEDAEFVRRVDKKVGTVVALVGRGFCIADNNSKEYAKWKLERGHSPNNRVTSRILGL